LGVERPFGRICLAGGDDPDDITTTAVTVANDESAKRGAQTEQDEAVFVVGVIGVIDEQSMIVQEDGLGLLERNAVLSLVDAILAEGPIRTGGQPCAYSVPTS
jgi:hypothetical protein